MNYYENYIYLNNKSISHELCNEIIEKFENEMDGKYEGITGGGLVKKIKNTTDYVLPMNIDDSINGSYERWKNIKDFLENELNRNTKIYIDKLTNLLNIEKKENNTLYYLFNSKYLKNMSFQIQKYNQNDGKFTYHDDFKVEWKDGSYRVITFLWYLNNVDEGGETEIWDNYLIKPETGKLLLFPSCWTFPHRGKMPLSSDKYIITGWLHVSK